MKRYIDPVDVLFFIAGLLWLLAGSALLVLCVAMAMFADGEMRLGGLAVSLGLGPIMAFAWFVFIEEVWG